MPYFKAETHQIRLRLELRPRPRWGAYSAPPDRRAGFKGPTSKRKEGKGESLVYATPLLGSLQRSLRSPSWIQGGLLLKGRRGKDERREDKGGAKRGRKRKWGKGGKGKG